MVWYFMFQYCTAQNVVLSWYGWCGIVQMAWCDIVWHGLVLCIVWDCVAWCGIVWVLQAGLPPLQPSISVQKEGILFPLLDLAGVVNLAHCCAIFLCHMGSEI